MIDDGWPIYYGRKTWKGVEGHEMRVKSAFKRGWRFLQNEKGEPKLIKSILVKQNESKEEQRKGE